MFNYSPKVMIDKGLLREKIGEVQMGRFEWAMVLGGLVLMGGVCNFVTKTLLVYKKISTNDVNFIV